VARTTDQILEDRNRALVGNEPDLAGLWNFQNPAEPGHDATPGAHHARMVTPQAIPTSKPIPVPLITMANPPAEHALYLDGTNSYFELPPNSFNEFSQATVEAWVQWDNPNEQSDIFDYGKDQQEMLLAMRPPNFHFRINDPATGKRRVAEILSP